jgi:hypothetical protein
MNRFTSRDTRGFTLFELPTFLDQREKAEDSAAKGGTYNISPGAANDAVDHRDTCPAEVTDRTGNRRRWRQGLHPRRAHVRLRRRGSMTGVAS